MIASQPGYGSSQLLRLGLPHAGPVLVPAAAQARIDSFDGELAPVVAFGAFECRLGSKDARVDFTLGFPSSVGVLAALAGQDREESGAGPWGSVRGQLRRWARSLAPAQSYFVWVEVDAPPADADDSACFPFVVHTLRESSDEDPERRAQDTRSLVATVLALEEDDEMLDGVGELARRLPDWCAVRHVALREAGGRRVLRAVCRMPVTQAAKFVTGGESSSAGRAMRTLVSRVHEHSVVTNVNFDLVPGIGKRVGVEFHLTCATTEDRRWRRLLDALHESSLLDPDKRAALERWPSPRAERDLSRLQPDSLVRDLVVKVDFDDRRAVEAKAYLTFAPARILGQSWRPGTQTAA